MNMMLFGSVLIIYLGITALLGYLGWKHTKTAADYLVAGRQIHPFIMALSYGATFISTSAIVGFGGAAAVYGMGLLWLTMLNIFVGIFIAFVIFGKRTRQIGHNLEAHTFPELIGKRFDSRFLQAIAGLIIFLGMPIYAGSVMIGGSMFLGTILGIPYEVALLFFTAFVAIYVIMGGLKGVMYTDAFQGCLMFIGMSIFLVGTYSMLGGVLPAHLKLTALAPEAIKVFGAKGHLGWTRMPALGSINWMQLVTTIVMGVGIGVLAQPQLVIRYMTVKSNKEINRAVVSGGIFILMMTGVAFTVGALTNVYFFNNPAFGKISFLAAEKNVDNIIPLFVKTAWPQWFAAVFMVTLLAAAMSTLSSQFHTMGSAIGRDVYEKGLKLKGNSLIISRAGTIVAILLSLFVAYYLPKFLEKGSAIIAIGTSIFFGLCAAAFLPMFWGVLYWKRLTKAGAISSMLGGFLISMGWLMFVHSKESMPLGISKALFGADSILPAWQYVDPIIVALPLSILILLVVTYLTKPPSKAQIDAAFVTASK